MLDLLGSLRLREHTPVRVVLSLSLTTRITGGVLLVSGLGLGVIAWGVHPLFSLVPGMLVLIGVVLITLERELVFDREAGVMRVDQRTLFLRNQVVVPLFHLRAVVIIARPKTSAAFGMNNRYVAFVERRVGDAIYLDESRRCNTLLQMAEAIAEVAEVRLEYDAMSYAR